jgi:HSP20 family protein
MRMTKHSSPLSELLKLQEDISSLIRDLSEQISGSQSTSNWIPNVDLSEDAKEFIVKVEVPGVSADHLEVVFQEGYLHLKGEKRPLAQDAQVRYLCLERTYGKFSRTIYLNFVVDINTSHARLQNGILTIVLPKLANRRKFERVIPVEVA